MGKALLEVRGLSAGYVTRKGYVPALRGVGLAINEGERVAVVGESGSGKSTLAAIMTRLEPRNLVIESGEVLYKGMNLLRMNGKELRKLRGREIAVVFQNPSESLNPLLRVGDQVVEALRLDGLRGREAKARALDLLRRVRLPDPERIYRSYPHELSGGQKQRVAIAIAIARSPKLLVADEPTTALDVSVQAKILDLLIRLNEEEGTTEVLITHDIGVAYDFAHRIIVMYAGRVVEEGPAEEVIREPLHPYTKHLIKSLPKAGELPSVEERALTAVAAKGCPYAPRCPAAIKGVCDAAEPHPIKVGERVVACHAVARDFLG